MPKFENSDSEFLKINVRFEITTFEIGYMQNVIKRLDN